MNLFIQDIKQAIRSLRHQSWQAAISVAGFVVGVVSLSFSANWLWTETHHDCFRPDYKDLYLLGETDSNSVSAGWNSLPLVELLDGMTKGEFEYGVYEFNVRQKVGLPDGGSDTEFYADYLPARADFVKTLGVKVLEGSVEHALSNPENDQVVITESVARRLFGTEHAVGRVIRRTGWNQERDCTVGAVIEDNAGTTNIVYDILCPIRVEDYKRDWGYGGFHIVVRTSDVRAVKRFLQDLQQKIPEDANALCLQPLRTLHKREYTTSFLEAYFYQLAFFAISLILAISGWVNIIAVYTSVYIGRSREYTLRRTLGGIFLRNFGWMLTGILPVIVAGTVLVCFVLEWGCYSGYFPGDLQHLYVSSMQVTAGFILLVFVGMLYPAVKLRRMYRQSFQGLTEGGLAHGWLLAVQCFACAFLLFLSWGMQRQIHGMIHADLGFDTDNILRLYTGGKKLHGQDERFNFEPVFYDLPDEFRKEGASGIVDAIAMRTDLFNRVTAREINLTDESPDARTREYTLDSERHNLISYVEIPYRAQDFFGLHIDGERLTQEKEQDGALRVLMNEAAMKHFRPDNRQLYTGHISYATGITTVNFRQETDHFCNKTLHVDGTVSVFLQDFHKEASMLMLLPISERHECSFVEYDAIYVKYAPGRRAEAEAAIRRVLVRHDVPEEDMQMTSLEEYIADSYAEESRYTELLTVLTVFCVLVTLAGVVSMSLYSLRLRRRCMAIRRVMGAGWRDIFLSHFFCYAGYVTVGCLSAYFPAVWLMHKWMEYFHFGEAPGVGLMTAIALSMLAVVTLVVGWQVRLSMTEKPVEVLQPES